MESIVTLLKSYIAIVGFVALVESLLNPSYNKQVSEYIKRSGKVDFSAFEQATINAIVNLFLKNKSGKLSVKRVFNYSLLISLLLCALFILIEYFPGSQEVSVLFIIGILYAILPFAFVSFPFDYFSIWVTKKIFWQEVRSKYALLPFWISDVLISLSIPMIFFLYIEYQFIDWHDESIDLKEFYFIGGVAMIVASNILISATQGLIIIVGLISRYFLFVPIKIGSKMSALDFDSYPIAISTTIIFSFLIPFMWAANVVF